MNKGSIVLAVASACVAPHVFAQTANPVTFYGRVYVSVDSVRVTGGPSTATPVARRTRVEDQSSLLGVRGTEDLGAGLKAFFQLETAFRADQNNTPFAARNSAVGLRGNWGSFLLGRWDMPFKSAVISVDPFDDLTIGGMLGVMNDGGNFDIRAQNVIEYWSPTWAGVAVRLAATSNETRTATANPRYTGANLTYTSGPLYLFGAYERHSDSSGSQGSAGINPVPGYVENGFALGGTFAIAAFKLGALYEKFDKDGKEDQKAWMGNVVYTLGKGQLIYQYQHSKGGRTIGTATQDPECHSHSAGYRYNFTKRTYFLGQYTTVSNNSTASCNFGANRPAIVSGQDPKGFALSVRHVF